MADARRVEEGTRQPYGRAEEADEREEGRGSGLERPDRGRSIEKAHRTEGHYVVRRTEAGTIDEVLGRVRWTLPAMPRGGERGTSIGRCVEMIRRFPVTQTQFACFHICNSTRVSTNAIVQCLIYKTSISPTCNNVVVLPKRLPLRSPVDRR